MAENKTTNKDYSSMKKEELLEIAKELGATVNSKNKKAEIIAAIEAVEKEKTSAEEPKKVEPKTEKPKEKPIEKAEVKEPAKEKAAPKTEKPEAKPEVKEPAKDKAAEEPEKPLSSTERKRKEKAERREAKAARKEANRVEEKKRRPSNIALAILIFGVLFAMFAFVGGYNYFNKPASIEKYFKEQAMTDYYTDVPYDEHSTVTVRADGNTIKMVFKVAEDTDDEHLKEYTSEESTEDLKEVAASFLTSIKPETQGFGGAVKVAVKKGDETLNYFKLSYREAKKIMKDAEKKAEEEADDAEDKAEDAADAAEDAADSAEDAGDAAE